ncbi:MAG: DUF5724 domain-containing protein [Chloroflexota bacterium]
MFQHNHESPLQPFQIENWREICAQRTAQLPKKLNLLGRKLLRIDDESTHHDRHHSQRISADELTNLSQEERLQLFTALFPRCPNEIDAAWRFHLSLPYGRQRAFRAPQHPSLYASKQVHWLVMLVEQLGPYEEDIAWVAQWSSELSSWHGTEISMLLAATIHQGGDAAEAIFHSLVATARNQASNITFGPIVIQTLLLADRPDGWEAIESLLLAAQRQEGLRQSILEAVDLAHPLAFRRMVRLILEHDLIRFSSVLRAFCVWFALEYDVEGQKHVAQLLNQTYMFLTDRDACLQALDKSEPEHTYLALCVLGFDDLELAIPQAQMLLRGESELHRYVAAYFLGQVNETLVDGPLLTALNDASLLVAATALHGLTQYRTKRYDMTHQEMLMQLEAVIPHFPAKAQKLTSPLWSWHSVEASQAAVADIMLSVSTDETLPILYEYVDIMSADGRGAFMRALQRRDSLSVQEYNLLLRGIGDRSSWVQEQAYGLLKEAPLPPKAAPALERYLTRRSSTLRQKILTLLLSQNDKQVLASGERLYKSKNAQQRQAGLALLSELVNQGRVVAQCQQRAQEIWGRQKQVSSSTKRKRKGKAGNCNEIEEQLIETILKADGPPITLTDGLGLFDPAERTQPLEPMPHPILSPQPLLSQLFKRRLPQKESLGIKYIKGLPKLIEDHANEPVGQLDWAGNEWEELLGNLTRGFGGWNRLYRAGEPLPEIPLSHLWQQWWAERPNELRNGREFLLFQSYAARYSASRSARYLGTEKHESHLAGKQLERICSELYGPFAADQGERAYPGLTRDIIDWLILQLDVTTEMIERILDAVEQSLYLVQQADQENRAGWRATDQWQGWLYVAQFCQDNFIHVWSGEDHARLWRLWRWIDEPGVESLTRQRPSLKLLMRAYGVGGASSADLFDFLIGDREDGHYGRYFSDLRQLSTLKPSHFDLDDPGDPELQTVVDRCRKRIIEVELQRGEVETAASQPALSLGYAGGATEFWLLLKALSHQSIKRSRYYRKDTSQQSIYTHLLRVTFPLQEETPDLIGPKIGSLALPEELLIESALYAPQWAEHIQEALSWPAFADAVWWLHAHTKDDHWEVANEIREAWKAHVHRRTSVDSQALLDGAVDVVWFHLVHRALGDERWQKLYDAAKFTSSGTGHKRGQLFAKAMLGHVGEKILIERINKKRHQDSVRALGLLPLPASPALNQALFNRYQIFQSFLQSGRKFGAQRRASEKLAVGIGMENLARTAGYPDATRLQWAMERQSVADLLDGPVDVSLGETTISLSINEIGEPVVEIMKKGRVLKHIPKAAKKEPDVVALLNRKKEIVQQARRMRQALEEAMCRGDLFQGAEVVTLFQHPILRPMLEDLVFVVVKQHEKQNKKQPGTQKSTPIGYPIDGGLRLLDANGQRYNLKDDAHLRLAHPDEIYATGEWHIWQQECFVYERIQPFRQIFRELYIITPAEEEAGTRSLRYAGHQVNARQATAILGKRGWIASGGDDEINKTFHAEGITAWIGQEYGAYTPLDAEGLTIESIYFTSRNSWVPLRLREIPPRIFSEVMRDVDLIVSVAHQGGIDPEASASTTEIRASLVRETANLLGLESVEVTKSHVLIDGTMSKYSVHLASGVVHQRPGNYVCIVPVHSQHRGHLFLPFIDDDPKTAEIISKVILLARDHEIQDPTILEQIRVRS